MAWKYCVIFLAFLAIPAPSQLNARTSILAAANPINSKWDPKGTVMDNIQLPPTLMSRFETFFLQIFLI